MTEKTNVPKIRFAGFTDPWEQRKLGEIAPVTMGQSPNGACYTDNPNDAVLVQGNADLKDGWVSPRVWTTEITRTAKSGDLIMSVRAPVGAMGKTAYDVVLGRGVAGIAGNEFLFQTLSKKEAEEYWSTVSAGSTFDSINGDELRNTLVDCPRSELECETIGDCLSKVDSLITLHQRKHEKLVQLKKSMLDKMFPKPGETEPEIRFAGFTDPWEQRKLGELLLFQNGFNGSSESFGSGVPLISVMDVLDDEFITHETVRSKARLNYEEASRYCVEYGDVLFQRSSENQEDAGTSNVYLDQHVPSAFGGFVIRGKKVDEYNPIFIKYLLGSSFIREQITHRAQGAQHINVSQDTLAGVVLLMPSMREQEAVGLVFLHLANLITLHQRKLELLRNTKKSLLERMFV